jgi:hypothetical protein
MTIARRAMQASIPCMSVSERAWSRHRAIEAFADVEAGILDLFRDAFSNVAEEKTDDFGGLTPAGKRKRSAKIERGI